LTSEIEKTATQIEEACNKFFNMRERMQDILEKGKSLDAKLSEVSEEIGKGLKDLHAKSEAIEEAWKLNTHEFELGRIERDGYERRLRQLTEEMSEVGFSFKARVCLDLNTLDRQLDALLVQIGVPSNLPIIESELTPKASAEEIKKIAVINEVIEKAREQIEDTYNEETATPEYFRRFGVFYIHERNWKKAQEYFSQALNKNNVDPLAWRGLGYTYFQQGNYTQAVVSYKTALNASPNDGVLWYNLGTVYCVQRIFGEAITCYKKAIDVMPTFAPLWCNLGITYSDMGDYRNAIISYLKALEFKPDFKTVWFNLAYAYNKLGYQKNAKACIEKGKSIVNIAKLKP
jgi:tetratricopeptide (TPR) repeat protein